MTPPVKPETDFDRWKAEQEFNAWKQAQGSAALQDMNVLSARLAKEAEREKQSAEEKKQTGLSRVGTNLQTATDMATFGLSGLADDALSTLLGDRSFAANRQARRMAREGLPTADRVVSTVGGALLNPVGAIVRAPVGAGLMARGLAFGSDAALQGGLTGAVQNLEDVSPDGLKEAGRAGLLSAGTAVPMAAGMRGVVAGVRGANTIRDVVRAKPLDIVRHEMQDAMRGADDFFYGVVKDEARGVGTTPALREILEHPTVRPYAERARNRPINAGASDAEIFLQAYKRMSEVERKSLQTQEGSAELLARIADDSEDIGFAKTLMKEATVTPSQVVRPGRAEAAPAPTTAQSPNPSVREAIEAHRTRLGQTVTRREGTTMQQKAREALERHEKENVVSPSLLGAPRPMRSVTRESEVIDVPAAMPTFPTANTVHAKYRAQMEAFENTADAIQRIMSKRSQKGEKILLDSPEALRRGIEKMTPAEALAAYQAVLGRGREAFKLSANPLTGFGVPGATIRTGILPSQINPYLRLLEKQAGVKPSFFNNPVTADRAGLLGARAAGAIDY